MDRQIPAAEVPCSITIRSLMPSMRESERKTADYVLSHPDDVTTLTILQLSQSIGVSEATVIRFCKKIGCAGFSELKLKIAREQGEKEKQTANRDPGLDIFSSTELDEVPDIIISRSIQSLVDTLKIFDINEYHRAVKAISEAERTVLYGVGNSASVASDAVNKFMRIGLPCFLYDESHLQIMSAANLTSRDAAIGISHSGMTVDTVNALAAARNAGAVTICITNYGASPITEKADIKLLTSSTETDFDSETMSSRIAQLAVIDMLYVGLIMQDYDHRREKIDILNKLLKDKSFAR